MSAQPPRTIEEFEELLAYAVLYPDRAEALLALAEDQQADQRELYHLYVAARHGRELDAQVRSAIASNPGIGQEEHFWYIAIDRPADLVKNPAFQAHLERDASFLEYWGDEPAAYLLHADCPPKVAAALVANAGGFIPESLSEFQFSEEQFRAMLPAALPAWREHLLTNPALPENLKQPVP